MTGTARESTPGSLTGLLCLAGRARIVVPASDVLQVIEYPVSTRLPLAARFVGGLGSYVGQLLISVAIDSKPEPGVLERMTKGVLVKRGSAKAPGWAVEVSQVRALVEVNPAPISVEKDHPEKARFVNWRRTREGDLVGLLDVQALITELSHARLSSLAS